LWALSVVESESSSGDYKKIEVFPKHRSQAKL